MSSSSSSKSAPNSPQTAGGMRSRAFKTHSQGPVASNSDWLAPTIVAARMITAAGECLPFPYVKGAFGMVVIFLETVEVWFIVVYVEDGLTLVNAESSDILAWGYRCCEAERFLEDVIHGVEEMRKKPQGFCAHIKEFVKSGGVQDKIAEYQKNIEEICSRLKLLAAIDTNFQVHKINATLATVISPSNILISIVLLHSDLGLSDITVVQATHQMNNCPPPSRIFQGRQAILDKMIQFFAQDIGKQHIYVLHGLGGAGKTQIALRFINLSQFSFSDNFFLDASTTETIETGLKNISSVKHVGNSSQDALKWLANTQKDWLLFYDNADDPKIDLNRFIPQCSHGNIIITTRNPALRSYAGAHFAVSDMEETDAVALLLKSAGQDISSASEKFATEIVQAGAFILQSEALDSYLDIYKKNRAQLLGEKPAQSHDNYAWTVYTTWQMSFDKLSPLAAMFLQLCSFLHQEGISEEIFSRAARYRFQLAIPSREELQKPLEFLAQFLGPALHSWSQTTITDQQSYHSIMAAIMGMSIAEIPSEHQQFASLRLISHVDSLRHSSQQMIVDFGAQYGIVCYHAARYEEAMKLDLAVLEKRKQVLGDDIQTLFEPWAEELEVVVLEKRRQAFGDDHPDTLLAMGNLASTYHNSGKFHKAEKLEVVVLQKRKQVLGDDHPDTLQAMGNLATTYGRLGKFHKAEELDVVVLEKRKQVLVMTIQRHSSAYHSQGDFQRANELEVVVLEKQRQVLGDDHPETLLAMGNLGWTYHCLDKFQQAEALQIVVLEKRKKVLGVNHPHTLHVMQNLASTYRCLGKLSEAEELETLVHNYEEALEGFVSGNSQGSDEEASEDLTQS
ncbi:hypothetical protein B0H13DRAFT_2291620 [Mycena leptocephala]|nr:hypothetical protein B0H13DRAFT_2291620 [Mycena leptocephala]